jgi:hypothetical protein
MTQIFVPLIPSMVVTGLWGVFRGVCAGAP